MHLLVKHSAAEELYLSQELVETKNGARRVKTSSAKKHDNMFATVYEGIMPHVDFSISVYFDNNKSINATLKK